MGDSPTADEFPSSSALSSDALVSDSPDSSSMHADAHNDVVDCAPALGEGGRKLFRDAMASSRVTRERLFSVGSAAKPPTQRFAMRGSLTQGRRHSAP